MDGVDFAVEEEGLLPEVRPLIRRRCLLGMAPFICPPVADRAGLRDRVRARLSRLESDPEPEPSFSSSIVPGGGDL